MKIWGTPGELGPAVGKEEFNCRRTVPVAVLSEQEEPPTTSVPLDGFETKMKQELLQPVQTKLRSSTARMFRRNAIVPTSLAPVQCMAGPHWQHYRDLSEPRQASSIYTPECSIDCVLKDVPLAVSTKIEFERRVAWKICLEFLDRLRSPRRCTAEALECDASVLADEGDDRRVPIVENRHSRFWHVGPFPV
jgi:hypothetical protein